MIENTTFISRLFFSACLVCVATISSFAQDPLIMQDSLYSAILKEQRNIQIVYPKGYNPASSEKYEVLYCLEGIPAFVRSEYNFLAGEGFIPNLILVGLPNTIKNGVNMRDRDFTPTHTYGETGGAGKFLSFLKDELMPFMQKHYPVKNNGHTLFGGSLSGLFTVYAFLKDPALFTSYIAIDPSLWWDNFYMRRSAAQFIKDFGRLNNTLWIAGREGNAYHSMGIARMDSVLASKKITGLNWKTQLYVNETHYSTQFKGLWDGLKFSYGGFYASKAGYPASRQIMVKPLGGLAVKGKPFDLICYNLAGNPYIRFTTDGTTPTISSRSLSGEQTKLMLSRSTLVRLRTFGVREEYNKEDSVMFETGDVLQSVAKPTDVKAGGLHYAYYEGDWDSIPNLSQLIPKRSGNTGSEFDLAAFPSQAGYALSMEGYIRIEKAGYYIFTFNGKNFRAFLNGKMILGNHIIPGIGQSYMVPLERGFYPLRIEHLHVKNDSSPSPLYIKPEGKDDFVIPTGMLYSR